MMKKKFFVRFLLWAHYCLRAAATRMARCWMNSRKCCRMGELRCGSPQVIRVDRGG